MFISKFGDVPWFSDRWVDKDKIINIDESVSGQATVICEGVTNMNYMFSGVDLHSLDLSNFDTSNVTNMEHMFDATDLFSLDVSNFNTSNVTNMSFMISNCRYLQLLDLSSFNTSNVENMSFMFVNDYDLDTIKGAIDMKSCTNYEMMFYNCNDKLKDVKIKNPPSGFDGAGLSSSQYTIVS